MSILKWYREWLKSPAAALVPDFPKSESNPKLTTPRQVILFRASGQCSIVDAVPSNSGWVARWVADDDEWSVLLPGGKVEGTSRVVGLKPHYGWDNDKKAV